MNQPTFSAIKPVKVAVSGLPQNLDQAQRADALLRLETQAQQRVRLGLELFNAADAQATRNRRAMEEVKGEQAAFRAEVEEDVTRSFHAYDEWLGQIDADLTQSVKALEEKMDRLRKEWEGTRQRIEGMVKRSEKLLSQTRDLMVSGQSGPAATSPESSASPAANPAEAREP